MMKYLTPTDYELAKANGISEKTLYSRVYVLGWKKRTSFKRTFTI